MTKEEEKEITRMVMEKYPKTQKERECRTEKFFRMKMREEYREKLTKQLMEKQVN